MAAGVSLRRMAAELGVSNPTVVGWESGKFSPTPPRLVAYAELLTALEAFASEK